MENISHLFSLAEKGDLAEIKNFLAKDFSVNVTNDYNESILITAIMKNQEDLIEYLLNERGDVELHTEGAITGTALTFAIFKDRTDIAKKLLEKEERFNNTDHPGAVSWAILKNNMEILKTLKHKGADFNQAGKVSLEQESSESEWLLKPEPPENEFPFHRAYFPQLTYTPLYLAILNKSYEIIEFLLRHCQVDPNKANIGGELPLQLAVRLNDEKAVEMLLNYHVNIECLEFQKEDKNIPSFLKRGRKKPSEAITKLIENARQKRIKENSLSNVSTLEMFSSSKNEKIPQEFIDMFKGAFEFLILDLADVTERERRILLSFLNDKNYTPEEIVLFSRELSLSSALTHSMDVLYCALYPEKWENTSFKEHKKNLLINTAEFSLPRSRTNDELNERINEFKKIAQSTVSEILKEEVILNDEEKVIKEKIIKNVKKKLNIKKAKVVFEAKKSKSLIDDYLESHYSENSLESETESDLSDSSRRESEVEKIKEVEEKIKKIKDQPYSIHDKWKSLDRFDPAWEAIYTLIKFSKLYNRKRDELYMLQVVKAILYQEGEKCPWKSLPQDFISSGKAYYYKRLWEKEGKLEKVFMLCGTLSSKNVQTEGKTTSMLKDLPAQAVLTLEEKSKTSDAASTPIPSKIQIGLSADTQIDPVIKNWTEDYEELKKTSEKSILLFNGFFTSAVSKDPANRIKSYLNDKEKKAMGCINKTTYTSFGVKRDATQEQAYSERKQILPKGNT